MGNARKPVALGGAVLSLGLVLTACGSSSGGGTSTSPSGSASVPAITASDFTSDFAVMNQLTALAAEGKGMVGVLLPDTTTSTRYVQYDAPFLKKAFESAGLTSSQYKVDNAHGSAQTMQTQAEADINAGATVLLIDAIDAGRAARRSRPTRSSRV